MGSVLDVTEIKIKLPLSCNNDITMKTSGEMAPLIYNYGTE